MKTSSLDDTNSGTQSLMEKNKSVSIYLPDYNEIEYYARASGISNNIYNKKGGFPIEVSFYLGIQINEYGLKKESLHSVILLNNLRGYVDNMITDRAEKLVKFNITEYNPGRSQYLIDTSGLEAIGKITKGVRDTIGKIKYTATGPEFFVGIDKNHLYQINIHKS